MIGWLTSELKSIFEADRAARYALEMTEQSVLLLKRVGSTYRVLESARLDEPQFEDDLALMRERVAGGPSTPAPVDLLLPDSLTLFRVETFQAEARDNLREEAWWRLGSLTPYEPQDLCYDVVLLDVEPNTGFLNVHVAIAPRDVVSEAVAHARDWGFSPLRVSAARRAVGFPSGPLFLHAAEHPREARGLRRATAALAAAAVLMAAIGVSRAVDERRELAAAAETRLEKAEESVAAAEALRDRALALAEAAVEPAKARQIKGFAVDWLEALTAALPPDAEADRVILADGVIRIEGVASNAGAVMAALDAADAFLGPRLTAPVLLVESRGVRRHRFAIEARLATEGAAPTASSAATVAAPLAETRADSRTGTAE